MRAILGWGAVGLGVSVAILQACVADEPTANEPGVDGGDTAVDGSAGDGSLGGDAQSSDGDTRSDSAGPLDGGLDAPVDACACGVGCNPLGQCLNAVTAIGVGRDHHCILRGDGRVFCMGYNGYGQLGAAPSAGSPTYVEVSASDGVGSPVRFKSLSTGGSSNCAISLSNDLYCWGANGYDQLGRDRSTSIPCVNLVPCSATPAKVDFGGLKVKEVSVGSHRTCVIVDVPSPDPNVRCWGYGGGGEWGVGFDPGADAGPDAGDVAETTAIPQVVVGLRAKAIQANDSDSAPGGRVCAISEANIPFCWGTTNNRELVPAAEMGSQPVCTLAPNDYPCRCVLAPRPFLTAGSIALGIGAGIYSTCALFQGNGGPNVLRCRTGAASYEPVGCGGDMGDIFDLPTPPGVDAKRVVVGAQDACIVDAKDELYCWGQNNTFQLGVSGSDVCGPGPFATDQRPLEPNRVKGPDTLPLKVDLVAIGTGNIVVYTKTHEIVGWGWANHGSIGSIPDAAPTNASCVAPNGQCSAPRLIPLPPFP